MIGLDWSGFLSCLLLAIVICQAGALHRTWDQRDRNWVRAERLDGIARTAWAKVRELEAALNATDAVVLQFPDRTPSDTLREQVDVLLDERAGVETWGPR